MVGCGSRPSNEAPPPIDPKAVPSIAQTAEKVPADRNELRALVDVPDYPNATVVEDQKLVSKSIPPDENRYLLTRKSADAPDKVAAFYEKSLNGMRSGEAGHLEVFGRTGKGNDAHITIEADGSGSKISLSVITYSKK